MPRGAARCPRIWAGAVYRIVRQSGRLPGASAGAHPSSNVVTPKMRCSATSRTAPVYMRAVSNTGARPRDCASATASRFGSGTSRNTSPPPAGGDQRIEHGLGRRAVIGDQRSDLEAGAAGADHAPGGERAVAHQRASDMALRADPGAQEVFARRREHGRVIGRDGGERNVGERRSCSGRRARRRDAAAVAHIAVGELEAGFPVVLLLRDDAVEPDGARARMRDRGLPDLPAEAAPAQVRPHDVEAEECEAVVVVDARDGRRRLAVELADQEAFGVDGRKARRIVEAGIPALGRRPVRRERDLVGAHRPDRVGVRVAHSLHFGL